jgi:hypothetical protein
VNRPGGQRSTGRGRGRVGAAGFGVLFAAVSAFWSLGGTWLLDTVGGSVAETGRRRDAGLIAFL